MIPGTCILNCISTQLAGKYTHVSVYYNPRMWMGVHLWEVNIWNNRTAIDESYQLIWDQTNKMKLYSSTHVKYLFGEQVERNHHHRSRIFALFVAQLWYQTRRYLGVLFAVCPLTRSPVFVSISKTLNKRRPTSIWFNGDRNRHNRQILN